MFTQQLRIPKKRIAVLIGKKASTKRKIEKLTNTSLEIDSVEGDVIITGEESLDCLICRNIILAISRGFNPDIALELINEDSCLEIIEIQDFTGKSKKKQIRLKARLIGTKGKCRSLIETLTNTCISIYGKTVSIIGNVENTALSRHAIEMILSGAPHGNVYKWLEKQKKLRKSL